jgi:membrane peptidoglycan carboxypeptidase
VLPGDRLSNKTSAIGRILSISAIGGVLAAAMVLPVVATTGVLVRNQADKFTALTLNNDAGLPQRSEILDRYGHLLAYVYGVDLAYYTSSSHATNVSVSGYDRSPVSFGQISQVMRQAVVAIEDSRYWQHGAIDVKGTLRALVNDLKHQPVQGGSTIAQQYVKNLLILSAPNAQAAQAAYTDTLSRKLNELRMAVAVEHNQSKQQILAGYLNDAYFENGAYGIEVAAETYFNTTAANLDLTQAALLAGIVENPTMYDPIAHPAVALERRNTVLARMAQVGSLTAAAAKAAEAKPLGINESVPASGCSSPAVGTGGFFCQYVEEVMLHDSAYGATPAARAKLLATGGLKIYTTLDPTDQQAASNAVNYIVPSNSSYYNPGHNADTEAVVEPGSGDIRAIAEDRPYGTGSGQTEIDYAVNTAYGGGIGVQTGSSSKLFTLLTALEQGLPFGFSARVPDKTTVTGYTDCSGNPTSPFNVQNSEGDGAGNYSLYTGTTQSINVYYAELEKKVGLCNVVQTAVKLGMTRADGSSLLKWSGSQPPADDLPTFTLGAVNVSPLAMAASYASVASDGTYCTPVAISKIVTGTGASLSVPVAGCHRVMTSDIAEAANYILQGVLTAGTAVGDGISRQAAGKTGTGENSDYAAFAGYTPTLVGYVSVFNPADPVSNPMVYPASCYRAQGNALTCPGEMFGANAPGATWQLTFEHASLGSAAGFTPLSGGSIFWSMGDGNVPLKSPTPTKGKGGTGGTGGTGTGGTGGTGGVGGGPVGQATPTGQATKATP